MPVSPTVVYFSIPRLDYPRNRRIREFLTEALGAEVIVCDQGVDHRGAVGKLRRFGTLWRASRGADVIVLAEFGTKYAWPVRLVATIRRAVLVVDGFVGLYETHVEDWGDHSPRSPTALLYRLADAVAARTADLYLIDTDLRAAAIRRCAPRTTVLNLPVGAPDWAVPPTTRPNDPAVPLRVLYYGNYIPLHGLSTVIEALADERVRPLVRLTLVGDGRLRRTVEDDVARRGLQHVTTFLDPVPEDDLAGLIADHHVVLGILGRSPKAASVIANKVWQGLACGRYVITRRSAALAEIEDLCGEQLITVPPADAPALVAELAGLAARPDVRTAMFSSTRGRLADYVASRFAGFADALTSRSDQLARYRRSR